MAHISGTEIFENSSNTRICMYNTILTPSRPTAPCRAGAVPLGPSHTCLPALPGVCQVPSGLPETLSTCCSAADHSVPRSSPGRLLLTTQVSPSATPSRTPSWPTISWCFCPQGYSITFFWFLFLTSFLTTWNYRMCLLTFFFFIFLLQKNTWSCRVYYKLWYQGEFLA